MIRLLAHLAFWVLLPPLLTGIINRTKAWVAGRRGPPLFQLYFDLARLWHKGVVLSELASPLFLFAPVAGWVALLLAACHLPLGPFAPVSSFVGDPIFLVYLLAFARFCTAWAALETGSAFEGMGSAREVGFAVLAELGLMASLLALAFRSDAFTLASMLHPLPGAAPFLLVGGLFLLLLSENCRVPFDDPNTHLELTMIHEVMVLDHSGPPLAIILHGAALKLQLFAVIVLSVALPLGAMPPALAAVSLLAGILLVAAAVGMVESTMARLAFRRVPFVLTCAFLLCVFALLVVWEGEAPA